MRGWESQQRRRVLAGWALALCLLTAGAAEARSITVRWRFVAPERAAGFRVHLGPAPGRYTRTLDVGKPAPDREGIYQVIVEVPDHEPTFVSVSAYGEHGEESPRSNESLRAPAPTDDEAGARLGTPGRPQLVEP